VERDPFLRRFERDAVIACAVLAVVVALVPGWGLSPAAGVLGGGGLAAVSYLAIKGGVTAAFERSWGPWRLVNFFTRYVILAVAAYVMLVRLRLHPVGLFVGASSPFLAAFVAAVRFLRPVSRSGHPRS
jgi:hypothetical protein